VRDSALVFDCPGGGDQCLPDYLPAVDALPSFCGTYASKHIDFYLLEIEQIKQVFQFFFH
jgi:hypothetical protein